MGDIADLMLNGDLCEVCGVVLEGQGYPQLCAGCAATEEGADWYGEEVDES